MFTDKLDTKLLWFRTWRWRVSVGGARETRSWCLLLLLKSWAKFCSRTQFLYLYQWGNFSRCLAHLSCSWLKVSWRYLSLQVIGDAAAFGCSLCCECIHPGYLAAGFLSFLRCTGFGCSVCFILLSLAASSWIILSLLFYNSSGSLVALLNPSFFVRLL